MTGLRRRAGNKAPVKDLLTGSGIAFAARGSHHLTGTAGRWPLFAVAPYIPS
jgi:hypothetical protein